GGNRLKIISDGLDGDALASVATSLFQICLRELFDVIVGCGVLVFGPREVECSLLHESWRFCPFEKDIVLVLTNRRGSDEIEFLPQLVQLTLLIGVEY